NVFMGGRGGSPAEPHIREQIGEWLTPYYEAGEVPEPMADPTLADIIWWKGDEVFVVEVSRKVDGEDVRRAHLRAETLRRVGVKATPAVVGEEWAGDDVQSLALVEGVEWMVARGLSPGFLRFRQIRQG
ncbi:MAG: hypothetical protein RMK92_02920, partial [Armatimonadota bacterium]|nr:hypothetical protein [Armatimonadota bacterium]